MGFTSRSCPWPVKSRLAVLRKERGHPAPQDDEKRRKPSLGGLAEAALGGDPLRGVRGLVDRAVVLVDRIDCRSRQAAHGPRDPGRIARVIVEWPSLSVREHRRGERAPEAGSRRQSREIGGGRCLRM
jgi:hypothetical protein